MKISYNPSCTLENATLEQDLKLCEETGFDYIELRIDKLREYLTSHTRDELQSFFRKSRIKPYAMVGIHTYRELFSEEDDREKNMALMSDIRFGCEILCAVGANCMIMVPPLYREEENKIYDEPWETRLRDNVRIFGKMSEIADAYEVNIGIKIIDAPRCSIRTIKECNEVIDAIGKKNVGYTLDPFNFYINHNNDFENIKEAYSDHIFVVHINGLEKEKDTNLRQADRGYPCNGAMNVKGYLEKLNMVGYDGPVSVDFSQEDLWKQNPRDVISHAFATTKSVMDEAGVLGKC